ncbi:hypothetical protein DMENIID0001_152830 [Sergentomyia squamirostris]
MDNKYKLLTSVDPSKIPVTISKKFSKLGRRIVTEEEDKMSKPTQRVLFPDDYDENKENSMLTDDEDDNEEIPGKADGQETFCSELSTQMSKLGIVTPARTSENISVIRSVEKIKRSMRDLGLPPDDPEDRNTQNMPSFNLSTSEQSLKDLPETLNEASNNSILTISSTDPGTRHSESRESFVSEVDDPEIIILDESSESDLPLKESIPPVSQFTERKSITSTAEERLNAFFDNVPTFKTSLSPHYNAKSIIAQGTPPSKEKSPRLSTTEPDDITLNETIEDDKKSDSGIDGLKPGTQETENDNKSHTVSISAKIKISIQIEERDVSSDEESDQKNDDPPKVSQKVEKKQEFEPQIPEMDEREERILNETYGDSWKTQKLLDSVKNRKKSEQPNYTTFFKHLGTDLESTRFPLEDKKTPSTSQSNKNRNTPRVKSVQKAEVPKYKRLLQICDSDSEPEQEAPEDSSFDEPVESSDSWKGSSSNSSSSDDESPIKKPTRPVVRKIKKKNKKRDLDFTQNASSDSDNTIFECKSPTKCRTPTPPCDKDNIAQPKPSTKRKLFSKKLYDMNYENPSIQAIEGERNPPVCDKDELDQMISPLPVWTKTPKIVNKKLESVKKIEGTTPKSLKKQESPTVSPYFSQKTERRGFGFLASLNPSTIRHLADPEAVHFRENYRVAKEDLTKHLYSLYNHEVFDNLLNVTIKWNKKLLTTAGRCTNMSRNGVKFAEIDLSEKVLTSADRLRCTLIHELCHAAAWIFDGEKKGHSGHWRKWASKANNVMKELPKISVCHQYDIEYKYTYQCVGCNAKTQMHSKSKKVENIRCKYCKSAIQVFLNKKNKDGEIVQTPVREASGFAKFVKEKYKIFKTPQTNHAETMKLLSQEFTKINLEKNQQKEL